MSKTAHQKTTSIRDWLANATRRLNDAGIPSAKLDSELILAYVLKKDRTWVISHAEDELTEIKRADSLLDQRSQRTPLAYLTGHKEFYGRDFSVNKDVLIPRPETEALVARALELFDSENFRRFHDVGTGSGCIAVSIACETKNLAEVSASDVSKTALIVAKENTEKLDAKVSFYQSDLLEDVPDDVEVLIANLPYVDKKWETSPETDYEPGLALYAEDQGLVLIKRLIDQAAERQGSGQKLLLEADTLQHEELQNYAVVRSYTLTWQDHLAFELTKN